MRLSPRRRLGSGRGVGRRAACTGLLLTGLATAGAGPAQSYTWHVVQEDGAAAHVVLGPQLGWPRTPLACDANGDGLDAPAGFVAGRFDFSDATGAVGFGNEKDTRPLCGDWDGDGRDTPALYRAGVWFIRNRPGSGPADLSFRFGSATSRTQVPVAGDWDGDGRDGIGIVDGRTWYLRQTASAGRSEVSVTEPGTWCAGKAADCFLLPADWDGVGREEPGQSAAGALLPRGGDLFAAPGPWVAVLAGQFSGGAAAEAVVVSNDDDQYDGRWTQVTGPQRWSGGHRGQDPAIGLLCDNDGDGTAEPAAATGGVFEFGDGPRVWEAWAQGQGDALCGDWDGNGTQTPGFYDSRTGTFRLTNRRSNSPAEVVLTFGGKGRTGVAGDWDGDGRDGVGVVQDGHWWMRDTLSSGGAQRRGAAGTTPLVGWDGRHHRSVPGSYASCAEILTDEEHPYPYVSWNVPGVTSGYVEVDSPFGQVLMDRRGVIWGSSLDDPHRPACWLTYR